MNAVVALCHFCEIHGPRVLFCCQPYHEGTENSIGDLAGGPKLGTRQFYGNYDDLLNNQPSTSGTEDVSLAECLTETCEACRSSNTPTKPTFLSNDHANHTSFVSSQQPFHPDVFSIVRQSCLRSLSCEVCPDREGPIFFGSDAQGYTVSHTFVLKDSKARGFQHWYSLIVVSVDKLLLLNSYCFIVKGLKSIIEELQWKAKRVYDSEQSVCSEKALRLVAGNRYATLPANFLRQRVTSGGAPRSFAELTGDKDIFKRLHRYCVWLLRAVPQRLSEKVLEGSPSEDVIVAMEMLELDESPSVEDFDSVDSSMKASRDSFSPTDNNPTNSDDGYPLTSNFDCIANLRCILNGLGEDRFRQLVGHLVVGDQIVVRTDQPECIREFLDSLRFLIPFGCAKTIYWGNGYEETFRCNLLGVSGDVKVPDNLIHSGHVVVIDVVSAVDNDYSADRFGGKAALSNCKFTWDSYVPLEGCLSIVKRYMAILSDAETYSLAVAESAIMSTREEWLNRAKVFFCFTRRNCEQKKEELIALRSALKLAEDDDILIKFWTAGLSRQYKMFVMSSCYAERNATGEVASGV